MTTEEMTVEQGEELVRRKAAQWQLNVEEMVATYRAYVKAGNEPELSASATLYGPDE